MTRSTLWSACCVALVPCLSASAQEAGTPPPRPAVEASPSGEPASPEEGVTPRTFVENASPATFGATVVTGADGRLIVRDVVQDSEAARAGLSAGDQLISVNGRFITEPEDFYSDLATHPADTMQMVVVRDGVEKTLVVNGPPQPSQTREPRPALGVRFLQANNVVLEEVLSGSPAERAGLQPGDHIVAVNDTAIASTDHFMALVAAVAIDSPLDLTYVRGPDRATVTLTTEPWDVVFGSENEYTTLKPAASAAAVGAPVIGYTGPDYYSTGVSAVGVPIIAFPTCYGAPYGYPYWGTPYGMYYGGYYTHPNWYVYAWPRYSGPFPGHPGRAALTSRTDSARVNLRGDGGVAERTGDDAAVEYP